MRKSAALACAAMMMLGCARSEAEPAPTPSGQDILLVGNKGEDTLSFIDLGTGQELGRVATGKWPHEIAISPDGGQAAVVAYGAKSIDVFDVATRAKVRTIDLTPNERPHGLLWLKDGRLIATTEKSKSVAIVDIANGDKLTSIATGRESTHMVAVNADGSRGYTANIGDGSVSVLDLTAGTKLRDIEVGGRPEGIALSADGRTVWVGDLSAPRAQAFDTGTFEKVAELKTGPVPIRVMASPDGKWIVSSNLGDGSLTIIDAGTNQVVRTVPVSGIESAGQVTILFSDDGKRLYAAETGRDEVAEVDLSSFKVLRRFKAGKNGDGLAIAPGAARKP